MDDVFNLQDDDFDLSDEDVLASFEFLDAAICSTANVPNKDRTKNCVSNEVEKNINTETFAENNQSFTCSTPAVRDDSRLQSMGSQLLAKENESGSCKRRSRSPLTTPKTTGNVCTPARKRRFPGPAGLLPAISDISQATGRSASPSVNGDTRPPLASLTEAHLMMNPTDDADFDKPLWKSLMAHARLLPGPRLCDIATLLDKSSKNELENGKVPLLVVLLKAFTFTECDGLVHLKDPSGEIRGTVHKAVLEKHQSDLTPGGGLILRQISVFSPNAKRHYVNITPSNIVKIIPTTEKEHSETMPDTVTEASTREEHGSISRRVDSFSNRHVGVDNPIDGAIAPDPLHHHSSSKNSIETVAVEESATTTIDSDIVTDEMLAEFDDDSDFLLDAALDGT